jgi:hypothetical protein
VLHPQPALLREADVGGGAADVERDHVVVARLAPRPDPADDARDGTRHQQVHGPRDRALGCGDAARRGHQVEAGLHVHRRQLLLEPAHVARDARADVRVQADGREALVLAVLRQHLRRDGEKGIGELLADDLGDARLVLRLEEREEEADRDRLHARLLQPAHLLARPVLVERHEHGAVARDPLGHGQPVAAADDRVPLPRQILVVREVERLLVPRDVEDVAVALGRDQADLRAVVLDDDVGRDRRSVEDLLQVRRLRARELGQLLDPLHRPLRGVVGRGRQLVHEDLPGIVVDVDQIGERPADVDSEAPHALAPGLRTILPKCSRRSMHAIASRASSSGNTL